MFDPLFLMALVAFTIFLWVRRAGVFKLRWKPDRSALVAIGASLVIFLMSTALTAPGLNPELKSAVLHIGIYAGLGVWLPLYWNCRIEGAGPEGLGILREHLGLSLIINIVLGGLLTMVMILQADWAQIDMGAFWAALFVLLTGNFFELIFYFGFVHLRLKRAFGPVVAVIGTAFLYVLWHVGTELMLVEDAWATAMNLFVVGILFQSVFALTYNLAIIFPFFVAGGVMLDLRSRSTPLTGWRRLSAGAFSLGHCILSALVSS